MRSNCVKEAGLAYVRGKSGSSWYVPALLLLLCAAMMLCVCTPARGVVLVAAGAINTCAISLQAGVACPSA